MKRIWILLICCLVSAVVVSQPKIIDKIPLKYPVDPALPTNLFSRYDSHLDLKFDGEHYQLGNLWSLAYAFNKKHQLSGNALLAYNGRGRALGIGDIELNYMGLSRLDTNAFFRAFGVTASLQLPTGIYDKYLGIGAIRFTPGVIATFQLSNRFYINPEAKYIFTSEVVQNNETRPKHGEWHGYTGAVRFIYKPTHAQWLWVTPRITTDNINNNQPEFELEFLYGVKVLNRLGFTGYVNPNFTTGSLDLQFVNSIYF